MLEDQNGLNGPLFFVGYYTSKEFITSEVVIKIRSGHDRTYF